MVRTFASVCILIALFLFASTGEALAQKNQMVKGTIKLVDPSKDLLVINQKLKGDVVDRELSILDTTEFLITVGKETTKVNGKAGLEALFAATNKGVGSSVNIKCDKDVNVLQVKVMVKK
jgi:hypothetical protein